ncbi:mannosyl-3-phosphoglycerate phosphatase [Palaeococcus ferrophilus]|uniref:Mannosyl-3-phosphoglycerate phosphatase n=1 Tax=Palaeococcus ferrophilus TaxID=83868 RepID=Q2VPS0_9EURY|nr:mannosyl-3-phosphoglycerate phosphatase [Palaeococcus ferrophilus]AAY44814.1 mannosyl-3-phosphoglycerate phosphatase [Palaeococcus ferrophilus DSM 13482]
MRVIFLDLDRTLLGDDYSPKPAKGVVKELRRAGFEVVFNSSKTLAEQEYYRRALAVEGPFIVENGSAVVIPADYFPFPIGGVRRGNYILLELGRPYSEIKAVLDCMSDEYGLKYYGNSTLEEVMAFTGLPEELARLAMRRDYSETIFRWGKGGFPEELRKKGLRVSKGSRFVNVTGDTDKGKAASLLLELYSRLGEVESYALGDGENDFPMLEVVDHAFIIGDLSYSGAKHISSLDELLEVVL